MNRLSTVAPATTAHSVPRRPSRTDVAKTANPSIGAVKPPLLAKPSNPTVAAGAPNRDTLITADASKVSPRGFLEALGLTCPEMREARRCQEIERCIRAIERGDTYGFPPVMVAECRHIMAMRAEVRL